MVVGASIAGLAAAEGLREAGYTGEVSVLGAETHQPYDRPPLSKQLLQGSWTAESLHLWGPERAAELNVDLRLGTEATDLDLEHRRVIVHGGEPTEYEGLIIATGAKPRTIPSTQLLDGVHVLRTLDDSLALRTAMAAAGHLVIIGCGFIGVEVAATARQLGIEVTVIEVLRVPLARVLGERMGRICANLHRDHGVTVLCGIGVAGFMGTKRVEAILLTDGTTLHADLVLVGIGCQPNTAWLEGSGLAVNDGVLCDSYCATGAPGVYAAGDVARWKHPRLNQSMRVEHWTNAVEQGRRAAHNLVVEFGMREVYDSVPYFWSDQYDRKIQLVGHPQPDDDVAIIDGAESDYRFVAAYGREGRLTAALAFNRPTLLAKCRQLLLESASWETALGLGK